MDKPRYKLPIFAVIVIFLILYFGLSALGAAVTFKFFISHFEKDLQTKRNLQLKETEYQNLLNQTRKLDSEQKYQEASASAAQALTKATGPAEEGNAYYWISAELLSQEYYTQSEQAAQTSVTLNPKYPNGYDILAEISVEQKNYQQALDYSNKLISAEPTSAFGYADAGVADYNLGKIADAKANFTKASQLDPKNNNFKQWLSNLNQPQNFSPPQAGADQQSSLGYTPADTQAILTDLGRMDSDLKNIQSFVGNSSYNQTTVNQIIQIIHQRQQLATQLSAKMSTGQPFNSRDNQSYTLYINLSNQQNALVQKLYTSQG